LTLLLIISCSRGGRGDGGGVEKNCHGRKAATKRTRGWRVCKPNHTVNFASVWHPALLAQLGERQTEDLKVLCSIHRQSIFCSFFIFGKFFLGGWMYSGVQLVYCCLLLYVVYFMMV
jgi:hypothetical protein